MVKLKNLNDKANMMISKAENAIAYHKTYKKITKET